jgi:hypothetical protein
LHEQDQAFGIAVQQAKVSDTPESFGQDMKQQAPEELCAREALDHLLACVVFDPKGDEAMAVAKDILFWNHSLAVSEEPSVCIKSCCPLPHPALAVAYAYFIKSAAQRLGPTLNGRIQWFIVAPPTQQHKYKLILGVQLESHCATVTLK